MRRRSGWSSESPGRVGQLLAIATLVLMFSVILHKGVADIARLARLYAGGAFWRALGRYIIANLSG